MSRHNYSLFGGLKGSEFVEIARTLPLFLRSRHHNGLGLLRTEVPKYFRHNLVRQAAELAEGLKPNDFRTWGKSGIRAQLFNVEERRLEMDFVVEGDRSSTHVLNAVSPAWTSSLSFGGHVAERVIGQLES
jgi:hypothetical protein